MVTEAPSSPWLLSLRVSDGAAGRAADFLLYHFGSRVTRGPVRPHSRGEEHAQRLCPGTA